jgi:hypothetical protein
MLHGFKQLIVQGLFLVAWSYGLASSSSSVVEHLPHQLEVQGLSPAAIAVIGEIENGNKLRF